MLLGLITAIHPVADRIKAKLLGLLPNGTSGISGPQPL